MEHLLHRLYGVDAPVPSCKNLRKQYSIRDGNEVLDDGCDNVNLLLTRSDGGDGRL